MAVFFKVEYIMEIHDYIQSGNFIFRKIESYIRSNPKIISYCITSLHSYSKPFVVGLITDIAHQRAFTFKCLGVHIH